jgi:hypothetical protein
MGEGVALRGLRPLWRLRRPRHIGFSCDALELPARSHARLLARSGAAAFGRAGAFGARWHLHWHAIGSSRAVQSRASARSQALDTTCVSTQKNYVVHGDVSFCAERKIPTNIAGRLLRTKVCKVFASKCPGGQIDLYRQTDT